MVAYSFKARFAEPILAGSKGGTIRAARKVAARRLPPDRPGGHARPGEMLQLYAGMRTKHCWRIADKRCLDTERIILSFGGSLIGLASRPIYRLEDLDTFARFDGFESWLEMCAFWHPAACFEGWHIRWLPLPEAVRG